MWLQNWPDLTWACSPCAAAAVKVFEFVGQRSEAREGRVCQSFAPGQGQPLRMGGFYWSTTAQKVCQHFMVSLHNYDWDGWFIIIIKIENCNTADARVRLFPPEDDFLARWSGRGDSQIHRWQRDSQTGSPGGSFQWWQLFSKLIFSKLHLGEAWQLDTGGL